MQNFRPYRGTSPAQAPYAVPRRGQRAARRLHRMAATRSTNYHRQVRLLGLDRSDVGGQIPIRMWTISLRSLAPRLLKRSPHIGISWEP